MKSLFHYLFLALAVLFLAVACNWYQQAIPISDRPGLTFYGGANPFIQITWNYSIADAFNIYRSRDNRSWEKIISNYPSNAHTAVDFNFPKDTKILYYRITTLDKNGREGNPSPTSSVSISESDETVNWEIYRNDSLGFEVKYPGATFQLDKKQAMLLHQLKNFHKYSLKDGSDLGLAKDITITFSKSLTECTDIEDPLKNLAKSFTIGNLKGLSYETGAEGEGVVYYCVKDQQNKTSFLIKRGFLSEAYDTRLPQQSDYLSSKEQEKLFNKVLSTFKFTK